MNRSLNICLLLTIAVSLCSCEEFLDKSPDVGIDQKAIYKDYNSIRGYLDVCYTNLDRWNQSHCQSKTQDMNPLAVSDELASSISTANFVVNYFNQGNWYTPLRNGNWEFGVNEGTIINRCYASMRIANRVIADIDKVVNISEAEKKEILGQAYFYRAWYYYQLIIRYGGMPRLDKVFNGGDDNIPRMTYRESSDWLVSDLDRAIELLPEKWDDTNYSRPDKAAAMGVKAQALLYAASPLMQNGLKDTEATDEYDKDLCLKAAKAAQDCLEFIRNNDTGRRFTTGTMDDYRGIFILPTTTYCHEEYLWWCRTDMTVTDQMNTIRRYWLWPEVDYYTGQDAASCAMPTYDIVSYYERKGNDGVYYPISDVRSGYEEGKWTSMQNRDPRMYNNILLPGTEWGRFGDSPYFICSWKGGSGYQNFYANSFSGKREFTGFLCSKYTWPECNQKDNRFKTNLNEGFGLHKIKSFYIRVTEMYLDYAEALFEATSNATAVPDGFTMSAADAINAVRARVGVTPVAPDYLASDKFRETYRRERAVEMMFENHRFEDIRRWMLYDELFSTTNPLRSVVWTCEQGSEADPANYNDGKDLTFTYEVKTNTSEFRNYSTKHYWYPFPGIEVSSLSNLEQNPGW